MKKKKLSSIFDGLHPDFKRHFGAIMDVVGDSFNYLRDDNKAIKETMDRRFNEAKEDLNDFKIETRQNFKEVFGRLDRLEKKTDNLETRADQTDQNFKQIDQNFKQIFNYLSRIEDELIEIKAEIKELKKTDKENTDRWVNLEQRVAKIEVELTKRKAMA